MEPRPLSRMQRHVRSRILSGIVIVVPIVITLMVLNLLFDWTAGFLKGGIEYALDNFVKNEKAPEKLTKLRDALTKHETYIKIISIVLLVLVVYAVGVIARLVAGRKAIAFAEKMLLKIPVVRPIYSVARQVVQALSLPDRSAFKAVVAVEFPRPGMLALGFLTGTIIDADGRVYCKVFIPTCPNPTTGFFQMIEQGLIRQTTMTVDEGFKMIISGGILSPTQLTSAALPQTAATPAQQ